MERSLMTKMTSSLLLVAAACAALPLLSAPARAEVIYPWCALYSDRGGGGATNCGFSNRQQCLQTISGVGGTCYANPAYESYAPQRRPRRHR
jgi:hypothetical protein